MCRGEMWVKGYLELIDLLCGPSHASPIDVSVCVGPFFCMIWLMESTREKMSPTNTEWLLS